MATRVRRRARVAEIAGVTRGAQIHHFPSKEDLVVAAIEHLAQQRTQAAMQEFGRVNASADPVATVLDFIWESHQGPLFVATMELWVASRTDPVLARQIARVEPLVNSTLITAIAQIMPDHPDPKAIRDVVYTAMDAVRGILVASFVDGDTARARRRWDRACVHLREIASGVLAASIRRLTARPLHAPNTLDVRKRAFLQRYIPICMFLEHG